MLGYPRSEIQSPWISGFGFLAIALTRGKRVAVLLPTPYLETFPKWFRIVLRRVSTCYAGYGPIEILDWDHGEFNLPIFRQLDFLIAPGNRARDKFIRSGVQPQKVVAGGDSLLNELRNSARTREISHARHKLLWAPHWTRHWEGGRGFSNWDSSVHDILDFARSHPKTLVILRVHGLLFSNGSLSISRQNWPEDEYAISHAAFRHLLELENVEISERSFKEDIEAADAILTDGISIIAYAVASQKNVCIVRRADTPAFGFVGKILENACTIAAPGEETRAWLVSQALSTKLDSDSMIRILNAAYTPTEVSAGQAFYNFLNKRHVRNIFWQRTMH